MSEKVPTRENLVETLFHGTGTSYDEMVHFATWGRDNAQLRGRGPKGSRFSQPRTRDKSEDKSLDSSHSARGHSRDASAMRANTVAADRDRMA